MTQATPRHALLIVAAALVIAPAAACESDKAAPASQTTGAAKGSGEFVPGQDDDKKAPEATDADFRGPGAFLLKDEELEGFALAEKPDYYTKEKLYEYMDGASDGYIAYNFVELANGVYKAADDKLEEEVKAEVFEFKDDLGALGKFAEERSNCKDTDKHPANWCIRDSDLLFWKGKHLIKVQTFDDSDAAQAAIVEVAQAVDKKVPGEAKLPEIFAKFPAEDKIAGSEGYKIRDSFGFFGLDKLNTALYTQGEAESDAATLFVATRKDEEAAKALMAKVKATLEDNPKAKASLKPLEGLGDEALTYEDAVGHHTFVRKGAHLAGAREFASADAAKKVTSALLEKL